MSDMSSQTAIERKSRGGKKKATNSFRTYLHKVLKNVHPSSQISSNTIGQLDEVVKILARQIAESARSACVSASKSTVGQAEVSLAVNLHLPGELAKHATTEIAKACTKFQEWKATNEDKDSGEARSSPVRREKQAGLIFSVALAEKFIREFGASDLNVSKNSSVALAAVLEYIAAEILLLAGQFAQDNKKVIIVIRHVFLGIATDSDLYRLMKDLGIEFLGSGVVPCIRGEFLPNKEKRAGQAARRRKNAKKTRDDGGKSATDVKKPHKYLPGTKALMDVRRFQKTTDLLLRKLPFQRSVRAIAEELNKHPTLNLKGIHFGGGSIEALQDFVEKRVTALCNNAVSLAIHGKRDGVSGEDIKLAWMLTNPNIPFTDTQIAEVGNNGVERLGFRGGVKRKGANMYSMTRRYMHSLVNTVLFQTLQFVKYRNVITIGIKDLKAGFRSLGINFTVPNAMGKQKHARKTAQITSDGESS